MFIVANSRSCLLTQLSGDVEDAAAELDDRAEQQAVPGLHAVFLSRALRLLRAGVAAGQGEDKNYAELPTDRGLHVTQHMTHLMCASARDPPSRRSV